MCEPFHTPFSLPPLFITFSIHPHLIYLLLLVSIYLHQHLRALDQPCDLQLYGLTRPRLPDTTTPRRPPYQQLFQQPIQHLRQQHQHETKKEK